MSIHTFGASARFDSARALTEDEMRTHAPSIFATEPHSSRSYRFHAIPTWEILKGLIANGFHPVRVTQSTTRDPGKRDFTKHMIRLRRLDNLKALTVGDTIFEIGLRNANDGTAAYELLAGLLKIRCLNGLFVDNGTFEPVKVRHTGDVESKVIEGTYRVLNEAEHVLAAPQDWSQIQLNRDERLALAEQAHFVRFADSDGNVSTPIQPAQLLIARRPEDQATDLWQTFNNLQENAVRGGLTARGVNSTGNRQRFTSREVKGIDQDLKLNKALWALTARMAEIKAAA